ncbi:MAG TPA: LuxR C-terminal-related transcriptional regulator [Thermoleophilaceae bacterium]|nr:LuxR C-terminal-related transcriptional regulator [Thermoleophilaceae bacterium]
MPRPRLLDLVERGIDGPLTLISAPAGSGKTVLLRSWMAAAAERHALAHVALTREHSDWRTFWLDVLAGMSRARPELSGVPAPAHASRTLAGFRAALDHLEGPLILVLDDFQEVRTGDVLADVEALLGRPHPSLRFVIATRSDPPVRLQRLRLAGDLVEIRAADLAFTAEEASELLRPLELAPADVETLWARTEGWVGALRLAELSLDGHPDPSAFIEGFAGDDRAVADYLTSEVLNGYDHETLRFLLTTSIVERVNAELAEALAGTSDGHGALKKLAHADGFVEPLDTTGTWFRYHPLLGEVLRAELRRRFPEELPSLHSAAARWYAANGQALEAARHAVAGADWQLAADLVGEHWLACVLDGSGEALRQVALEIPDEVLNDDAELALAMAGLLLEAGELGRADERLVRAYELAERLPPERRRRFRVASVATALSRARLDGDLDEALSAARLALREDWDRSVAIEVRALTLANVGVAEFWAGDADEALERLQGAAGLALEFGNDYILFVAECYLAAIHARQGRLEDAHSRARTAIQLAERRGWTEVAHIAIAYVALATVHLWWSELDDAERAGDLALEAVGRSAEPLLGAVVAQLRAKVHAVRGDPMTGLDVLRAGDRGAVLPDWLRVSAGLLEGELWLALGEPARARSVLEAVSSSHLSDSAIGLARLELAVGEPESALRAIAGFLADERATLMPVTRTEAWTVDAIARDAIHDEPGALRAMERALDLAEPRGYSNPILRYGAPVRSLLRRRIAMGTGHRAFAGELLSALEEKPTTRRPAGEPLLEPLSERELAVLRFLPTLMSNAEIASEMFVSVNTVKTHLKHIYRKLDVSERREAVRRGRELHLLSPGLGDP